MTRVLVRTEDDEVSGKKGIKVKRTKYSTMKGSAFKKAQNEEGLKI